ncbi:MAG: DUF2339 domain-containing protein [Verrucomicrobiota bacterium]
MDVFLFFLTVTALIVAILAKAHANRLSEQVGRLERLLDGQDSPEPKSDESEAKPTPKPPPLPKEQPTPMFAMEVEHPPSSTPKPEPQPAAAVAPEAVEEAQETLEGPDLRELLRRIHLWPPDDGDATEVRLASWWATRLGIVFGVITAVFFAVYNSPNASPEFRLGKLGAVSLVFVGLGFWLERKLRTFGQILSAGGLAMLYVTAFAAYAFEPMKVIENPWIGLVVQLLGVAAMAGYSIWKRSEPLATAAILLGYISCWFSHQHGLHSFTLVGLISLAVVACGLFLRMRWIAPFSVAMAGGYIGYALLIPFRWSLADHGSPGFAWILPAALVLMGIFHLTLHSYHMFRGGIEERWRMLGVLSNTTAALTVGLIATAVIHPDSIASAYLIFGVALSAVTALEFWGPRSTRLTSVLFLKTMAAFALFSIYEFVGPAEWLAIAIQSLVLAIALKWSRSRAMEVGGFVLWVAALWLFIKDVGFSFSQDADFPHHWGAERWLALVFILIQVGALSFHRLWVAAIKPRNAEVRNCLISMLAIASGAALSMIFLIPGDNNGLQLLAHIGAASGVAALALAVRTWPALIVSGTAFIIATFRHFGLPQLENGLTSVTLIDGLLLIAAGFAAAELVTRLWPVTLRCREWVRALALLVSLAAFLSLLVHISFEADPLLIYLAWSLMLPVTLIISNRWQEGHPGDRADWKAMRWIIATVSGLVMLYPMHALMGDDPQLSLGMFLVGAIALAACFVTKDSAPVATATPLFLVGLVGYVMERFMGGPAPLWEIATLAGIPIVIATLHRWRLRDGAWEGSKLADGALHMIWMIVVLIAMEERMLQTHFIAVSCCLALAVYGVGLKLPFFSLRQVTFVPAAFAAIYSVAATRPLDGSMGGLWIGFVAAFLLTLIAQLKDQRVWYGWLSAVFSLTLGLVATLETFVNPWDQAGLGALGLAFVAAWRFANAKSSIWAGIVAFSCAGFRYLYLGFTGEPTMEGLLAVIGLSICLLAAGLLIATAREDRFYPVELREIAAWMFPILALLAFMPAVSWRMGPAAEYATAWWGAAGSLVFLAGLILRLRAYRIAGLIGIGLCIIRMFIVDIDDTFGRIVAFGVVAAVLLVVGYLYTRFREFIEGETERA